ncbi:HAMP domain-containing histidine kinase [Candidatus Saccharibacteria bacterium]|nr:HAMP domain-containing histidine kinase [Candidatus Saccharibacteria bacterium]
MFKKLRNKLILINLGITSIVIIVSFSLIYVHSTRSAEARPPMMNMEIEMFDEAGRVFDTWVKSERQAAAQNLLITLIVSGIAIEFAVALISYFLAEEAIKPIKNSYEQQKVFIANASHEIKTPLAAISANLEAADIKNNRWIDNVAKETDKLTALNSELLTLARSDLVNSKSPDDSDLKTIIEKQVESFEPRLKGISFKKSIKITDKTKINGADFSQIFSVLMDNAIKYCDKSVSLSVSEHEFSITNDGAKIDKDSLPHIFDRFYQVDKNSEGVGLGLSIAKSLADRNNWVLTAKSDEKTTFLLKY